MAQRVRIIASGVLLDHLRNREVAEPFEGVLKPDPDGGSDPLVTFYGKRGGAGFLCLSTLKRYGSDVVPIEE
jgi:hypothetical protein